MARKHRKLPGKRGIPGTTTYIRVVRLGKWFPANDPLATSMARLMILREDLMLELRGIHARSIPLLDVHSNTWRLMYFFRSSVRTLWEIQGALTTIRSNPEFKRIFRRMSPKEQNTIAEISSRLNAAAALTREIRNAVGGHVLPAAVSRALDNLAYERFGVLEFGAVIGATHYKVAGELILEMLVTSVPEKQKMAKLEATMRTMADLLPVVESLELLLFMYATARGLV